MSALSAGLSRADVSRTAVGAGWLELLWVFILGVAVYLIRARYEMINPQFWAEDATVFFTASPLQALRQMMQPYAGYLHIGPRSIALIGSLVPGALAPVAVFWAACLTTVLCSVVIYALGSFMANPDRVLFALAPIMALPGGEIYGNATNTQWFLGTVLGVLVLCYRQDRFPSPWWLVLALFLALTGPFSVFLFPIFLGWALLLREVRLNRAMLIAVGMGAAVQLAILGVFGPNKYGAGVAPFSAWLLAARKFADLFVSLHGWLAITAMALVFALPMAVAVGGMRRRALRSALLPLVFVALAVVTLLIGWFTHKHQPDLIGATGPAERYFLQPFAFLLMALAACGTSQVRAYRWSALMLIPALVIGWGSGLKVVRKPDLQWGAYYRLSQVLDDVVAPILPNWVLPLPRGGADVHTAQYWAKVDLAKQPHANMDLVPDGEGFMVIPTSNDPRLSVQIPAQCQASQYRFLRASVKDAVHAQIFFPGAAGSYSELHSLARDIGAGDHMYFPLPMGLRLEHIRFDVTDKSAPVRGLALSWICFN